MLPVKNLFVLYTGGTIGMLQTPQGLAPAGGFEARMRDHLQSLGDAPDLRWRFAELQPPLDSANMTQGNWLAMRDAIVAALDAGHDGVLLLHGTDTLAYSAAALSFLLLDLPVPVLLTGSMLPAGAPGSDAWDNLVGALRVLQEGHARGVQVYFNDALLHGARVSKLRSDAFDAFAELPRPRHAEHAPVPAALGYRQPRREVNLAVLPLYQGCAPRTCAGCSTAAWKRCCWNAMAAAPARPTTRSCWRCCAKPTPAACCSPRSASAPTARSSSASTPPAAACATPACSRLAE